VLDSISRVSKPIHLEIPFSHVADGWAGCFACCVCTGGVRGIWSTIGVVMGRLIVAIRYLDDVWNSISCYFYYRVCIPI